MCCHLFPQFPTENALDTSSGRPSRSSIKKPKRSKSRKKSKSKKKHRATKRLASREFRTGLDSSPRVSSRSRSVSSSSGRGTLSPTNSQNSQILDSPSFYQEDLSLQPDTVDLGSLDKLDGLNSTIDEMIQASHHHSRGVQVSITFVI